MRQATALDLRTRATAAHGGDQAILVVLTRRRAQSSEAAVRACDAAASAFGVDAVTVDVDAPDNRSMLDELAVQHVPEILLMRRGVLLDRAAGVRDADDAYAWIASTLRKPA